MPQEQAIMATVRRAAPHLLQRVQQGISKLELVYTPHSTWPLPHANHVHQYNLQSPLRVSILDSSFNPPTLAHLALANSCRLEGVRTSTQEQQELNQPAYHAKLLLLSVKNADKSLKPGDATYVQRLEMMSLLAEDVKPDAGSIASQCTPSSTQEELSNVAIAITDEPTFVGKSEALTDFLKHKFTESENLTHRIGIEDVELSFLVGLDTLERLFSLRYYPSETVMLASLQKFFSPFPDGDNSRVVCARRVALHPNPSSLMPENPLDRAKEYLESGRIAIIDIGDEISTYSSTTVRRCLNSIEVTRGSSWRKLVGQDIANYITEHNLYKTGP